MLSVKNIAVRRLCSAALVMAAGVVPLSLALQIRRVQTGRDAALLQGQKEALERQLETALERAESAGRAKSEFLFNMSHDLRTPMNAILGFTALALESGSPEAQREYLKKIDVSSRQLLTLIDSILELSRLENHKALVNEELADLREICQRLSTVLEGDLRKKHLAYTVHTELRHPYLYLDTAQYSRVFLNVVSNAIRYTPDGGSVFVSLTELPGDTPDACVVETRVEDTGIGMSPEFLARACEAFSRERTSTVSGLQGAGLGLTIVKDLVEILHGTVSIKSRQGEGTQVVIRLPHRLGEAPAAREEAPLSLFRGRRVLLAEDIDVNAIITAKLLAGKGFLVERARDGAECADMLLRSGDGYFDLILMDIQMPVMDGCRAAEVIRGFEDRRKASIPILALTASTSQEDRDRTAKAGMNGHIAKPLDAGRMFQAIAEVLGDVSNHQ